MRETAGGARMLRPVTGQPYAEVGLVQRDLVRRHLAAVVEQHRVRVHAGLPDHKVLQRVATIGHQTPVLTL